MTVRNKRKNKEASLKKNKSKDVGGLGMSGTGLLERLRVPECIRGEGAEEAIAVRT